MVESITLTKNKGYFTRCPDIIFDVGAMEEEKCKETWAERVVEVVTKYKPKFYHHRVTWEKPELGWVKCNTDRASRGNPGESSYSFCLRNNQGDLIYAET
ncbi:hypothetical protein H5410_022019 [Solanum commersonii]|uniref:Uncharacterized protein n=1 Tax=Solanum commersonii TaxID=4109 RepID=A0A9J5ZDL0_SOLCO|nr:hypothetical protein H5410_022019 [Solanum commersonii]